MLPPGTNNICPAVICGLSGSILFDGQLIMSAIPNLKLN